VFSPIITGASAGGLLSLARLMLTSAGPAGSGRGRHLVPVVEPLALDQHLCAGDEHDAVLLLLDIEVRGSAHDPLPPAAVGEPIAALQMAELLAAERPPGRCAVHKVKRMRQTTNRCTHNLWRTRAGHRPPPRPRPSPASARSAGPASGSSARRSWPAATTQLGSWSRLANWSASCGGLEEWDHDPDSLRPIPHVALSDHQVGLIYSLVLLALVQKTESAVDRPGEPRYCDARDRWLACGEEELEEVRARLAEVWGSRLGGEFA
jgi:hypothetical protein